MKAYVFLAACVLASPLSFGQQTGTGSVTKSATGFESVSLGDRALRFMCVGKGSPTVIVESALGNSVEANFERPQQSGWAVVIPRIAKDTRVCAYDRAGLGKSSPQTVQRTNADSARELHALLEKKRVAPPYVFAGHSIGGLNARAFATEFPNEAVGMVLIDATSPEMRARTVQLLPPPVADEPALFKRFRDGPDRSMQGGEWYDMKAIEGLALANTTFGAMPLIVLTRSPDTAPPPGAPPEGARVMEALAQELQANMTKLSTRSKQVVATKAGHFIQEDEPDLVVDSILDVVRQARERR
jgi:pimeloyl-ACP methyl ester carboxylesterase